MNKKYLMLMFMFLLVGIISAQQVIQLQDQDTGTATGFNVNSSDFWDNLDTPSDIAEYPYWYNYTSITDRGLLDYSFHDISANKLNTSFLRGVGSGGVMDMRGNPWFLSGVDFMIDRNIDNENVTLILNSDLNQYACINLTEGGIHGFSICNDGAGINRFVIRNYDTENVETIKSYGQGSSSRKHDLSDVVAFIGFLSYKQASEVEF